MVRWQQVRFHQRVGAGYGDPYLVDAQRFDRSGRLTETGEIQIEERNTIFRIRAEAILGIGGTDFDLPAALLSGPREWVVFTDGGVYNVQSTERVTSPPGRYLTVRAEFQGEAPVETPDTALLWPGETLIDWPGSDVLLWGQP